LEGLAEELLQEAKRRYGDQQEKVKLFSEGSYRAGSWEHARRVVYKAEAMEQGTNTRFLVSTRNDLELMRLGSNIQTLKTPELMFRALLTKDGAQRLELARS
jgi:hypothetical protein